MLDGDLSEIQISDIPGFFVVLSDAGKILNCNRWLEDVSGYTKEEAVGMNALDFFPREEKPLLHEKIQQTLVEGGAHVEAHLVTKDGRLLPMYITSLLKTIDGKPVLVCLGITITDRKRLEEISSFQAYLLDSVADAVASSDENFNIVAWNRAAEEMYGIREEDALGKNVMQLTKSEISEAQLKELLKSLAETGKGQLQTVHHRQDGSPFHVDLRLSTLTGGFARYVAVTRDVTERVEAEKEKELLIAELQQALDEVKTLGGMLPICASCKKIRDDKGYWQQVEVYVTKHSEAEFTHGLCPECSENAMSDYLNTKSLTGED